NLIKHSQEADILVHEVLSSPAFKRLYDDPNTPAARRQRMDFITGYHTPSSQLGAIASDSNVRHLVMSHLIMYGGTREELIGDVRPGYKGDITVGEDLMTFELAK